MVPAPADRVFHNGKIYTVDEQRTWAAAVAITAGRISYVGDNAGAAPHIGDNTELTDLGGQMMLPGFFDCHIHLASGGLQERECNLAGTRGHDEALAALRSYIATAEPGGDGWIRGFESAHQPL